MKSGTASKWAAIGFALVGLATASAPAATSEQVRFEISRPFRVGSRGFAAGVIAVHSISAYTPRTSILEIWVNGECLGMMTALRSVSEEPPTRTEALFRSDVDGRLEMTGFRMTGRPTGTTYRFAETK